ncbi:MAG TPA: PAS domain-containing protein [Kofleriaceae bacterium]|nr:PAS domain-containing protein [Kofleriaceae bacterium]
MTWWEHAVAQIEIAVITTNAHGEVISCNPCAATMFAADPAALVGVSVARLIPGADVLVTGRRAERVRLVGLRQNAVEFPLELALSRANDGDDSKCLLVVRDLSDDVQLGEPPTRRSRPAIGA